jgi:hypothetical protein
MSWLDSGLLSGTTVGIFFPHFGCDLVASKTEPLDPRLAIATDLLAQIEARHRAATRLQEAARQLSRGARDRASASPPMNRLRRADRPRAAEAAAYQPSQGESADAQEAPS